MPTLTTVIVLSHDPLQGTHTIMISATFATNIVTNKASNPLRNFVTDVSTTNSLPN